MTDHIRAPHLITWNANQTLPCGTLLYDLWCIALQLHCEVQCVFPVFSPHVKMMFCINYEASKAWNMKAQPHENNHLAACLKPWKSKQHKLSSCLILSTCEYDLGYTTENITKSLYTLRIWPNRQLFYQVQWWRAIPLLYLSKSLMIAGEFRTRVQYTMCSSLLFRFCSTIIRLLSTIPSFTHMEFKYSGQNTKYTALT